MQDSERRLHVLERKLHQKRLALERLQAERTGSEAELTKLDAQLRALVHKVWEETHRPGGPAPTQVRQLEDQENEVEFAIRHFGA